MSIWIPVVGLCVVVGLGWSGRTLILTGAAFLAELRLQRAADPRDVRTHGATLGDAESSIVGAQDGLRTVLRRLWWELLGFGDPTLRQRELVHACGELLNAQRAMREVHRRSPYLALDPGPSVGFVEDPVRALAVSGNWLGWFGLMLLPGVVRGVYTVVVLRRAILPLLETASELEDQLAIVRHSVGPVSAPERTLGERLRLAAA